MTDTSDIPQLEGELLATGMAFGMALDALFALDPVAEHLVRSFFERAIEALDAEANEPGAIPVRAALDWHALQLKPSVFDSDDGATVQ